jgi:hypothetical protein
MQYAQPPYNPYAYAAQPQPLTLASIDATGHRANARLWFLITALASGALYFLGFVGFFTAMFSHDHDLMVTMGVASYAVILLGALLIYVKIGFAFYWLHGAWKWIPFDQRAGKDGKRYTPENVFMLLIPYYNLYYMFPINLGLCDAMERLRASVGTPTVAKRDMALFAAIAEIVPLANFFVAPFLWSSYMASIDTMHEEIATALAARAPAYGQVPT